jgi:hypothetical protein
MNNDNIHLLNTGATASAGCITVSGYQGVPWTAGPGQETYVTLPAGTIGGPVTITVTSGPAVLVSQRVEFYSSFNELQSAGAGQAVTTGYFNWYDKAGPGMLNDNIHLLNTGTTSTSVAVTVPGAPVQTATVPAGGETYVTFPQGTVGGPVTVSSAQPVLASQRVQFQQSFNEIWASSAPQGSTLSYFNWYDPNSPGVAYDFIHLTNVGTAVANVSVTFTSCSGTGQVSINPGQSAYTGIPPGNPCVHPINCPNLQCPGPAMGGPVYVRSDQPVLASQRVQWYSSFSEIWSRTQGTTTAYFNWYDRASPGMNIDNIHISNIGSRNANITVTVPGASQTAVIGASGFISFPQGTIAGPVTVTSDQPILASQRVQYYQSFSETWSS